MGAPGPDPHPDSPCSGSLHRGRRAYLRGAVRELEVLLEDQPGLLGPKVRMGARGQWGAGGAEFGVQGVCGCRVWAQGAGCQALHVPGGVKWVRVGSVWGVLLVPAWCHVVTVPRAIGTNPVGVPGGSTPCLVPSKSCSSAVPRLSLSSWHCPSAGTR